MFLLLYQSRKALTGHSLPLYAKFRVSHGALDALMVQHHLYRSGVGSGLVSMRQQQARHTMPRCMQHNLVRINYPCPFLYQVERHVR
nr:hypothetical protein [Enterovibrio nigricans]